MTASTGVGDGRVWLLGVTLATRSAKVYSTGEQERRFSIQSVSKPFTAGFYDEPGEW